MSRGRPGSVPSWTALALVLAILLTAVVVLSPAPLAYDVAIAKWVQEQQWFSPLADGANRLNGPLSWPALVLAAFWLIADRRLPRDSATAGIMVLLLTLVLRSLTPILKEAIGSPRPEELYGVAVEEQHTTFGFPSGHVYTSVLVYGAIAWCAALACGPRWRPGAWAAAFLVMATAGPARVFVGAHWPTDVLGGYLWGAAALGVAVTGGRWWSHRHRPRGTPPAGSGRSAPAG